MSPIVRDGKTDATVVTVFGVLGGVATAAGVTLLITAPSRPSRRLPGRAAVPAAWVELGAGGRVALGGAF